MRSTFKRKTERAASGVRRLLEDDEAERALLAEFQRHDSVAALARALAGRPGETARDKELIAEAGLGSDCGRD